MNDPSGVHSAVLGMLSLSQQGNLPVDERNYSTSSVYPPFSAPNDGHPQLAYPQSQFQMAQPSASRSMPLTPPRSPSQQEEELNNDNKPSSVDYLGVARARDSSERSGYSDGLGPTAGHSSIPSLGHSYAQLQPNPTNPAPLINQLISTGWSAKPQVQHPLLAQSLADPKGQRRKSRNDKKPIPLENKDSKYFERRKKNNEAAKKSRDSRKHREEEIFTKASYLERENAILQAQVDTLRHEAQNLAALIKQRDQMRQQQGSHPSFLPQSTM